MDPIPGHQIEHPADDCKCGCTGEHADHRVAHRIDQSIAELRGMCKSNFAGQPAFWVDCADSQAKAFRELRLRRQYAQAQIDLQWDGVTSAADMNTLREIDQIAFGVQFGRQLSESEMDFVHLQDPRYVQWAGRNPSRSKVHRCLLGLRRVVIVLDCRPIVLCAVGVGRADAIFH